MGSATFDEQLHPREHNGQFAVKQHTAPQATLEQPRPTDSGYWAGIATSWGLDERERELLDEYLLATPEEHWPGDTKTLLADALRDSVTEVTGKAARLTEALQEATGCDVYYPATGTRRVAFITVIGGRTFAGVADGQGRYRFLADEPVTRADDIPGRYRKARFIARAIEAIPNEQLVEALAANEAAAEALDRWQRFN